MLLRSAAESAAFGGRLSFVRVCVIGLRHENSCSFVCVIGLRHGLFRTQHCEIMSTISPSYPIRFEEALFSLGKPVECARSAEYCCMYRTVL